jgi:hypothetical protein
MFEDGDIRIYFDVKAIEEELRLEAEEAGLEFPGLDIVTFRVYECASKHGTFIPIADIDYIPTEDFITISEGVYSNKTNWFSLAWIDSGAVESDKSEPVLAEDMIAIIDIVSTSLGDTDREDEENQVFSDEEYVIKFRGALKRYKGDARITGLFEYELDPIILLVRISCCYDLAYDNARYSKLGLPDGIILEKGERVEHYLDIAKALERHYKELVSGDDGAISDDGQLLGTPTVEVVKCTRTTSFSDLRLPPRR